MKIHQQASPELTQLAALIEPIGVAMLCNRNAQGMISSRPMAALEMDAQGAIWFFTDENSAKIDHLNAINLSFVDRSGGTYVSLSGSGEIHKDRAQIDRLWTAFARPWFPEGKDAATLALLKFIPDAAEYWDAPHSRMIRVFAIAASVLAGKPIGLGDHEKLSELSRP